MTDKQVGIALHKHFFIRFFQSYNDLLENLTKIKYGSISLKGIIKKIKVLYSTYSHYLKENELDTYLKDLIEDELTTLNNNKEYQELLNKAEQSIGLLNSNELSRLNLMHNQHLMSLLEVFGIFCNSFADSDLFPKLTRNVREHDKAIIYVVYDVFYESFYKLHSQVQRNLDEFNITMFNESFKLLLVFFQGYNYYLEKNTIKILKDKFNELIEFYNNEEFLFAYYNLLQGNMNDQTIKLVKTYNDLLLNKCIEINELINGDLPKTNMFPRRIPRIFVDTTLI